MTADQQPAPGPALPPGLVRPALAGVDVYEPGRPVEEVQRETGIASVVKLASNEGPFPPMPRALAAIRDSAPGARVYPDAGAWALRDAIAARTGLDASRVLPGAGVDGLIKLMSLALLDPGDEVVMGWPSFLSWRLGAQIQGAETRLAPLRADGSYDLGALAARVGPRTKMVVVVSPNNPTGGAVAADELRRFLDALPGHVLPVIDEAYFEYLPAGGHDGAALVAEGRTVAALRTFSKAYGLAGLRVGYLMGPAALVRALGVVRNVFDVSSTAQAAAVASLEDADEHLPGRISLIAGERAMTASGLRALGLEPLPSSANFLLVDLGAPERAQAMSAALLARGVIVRPARAFGAPSCLRVTIGRPEENARFLAAAAGALAELV
ncbi:pyridoxal phosphate-dependent aminotransferase [Miltoncostaea marina]|uniref:pyridoxal phosphate-dependent aminotransferase n=1 Tax=Miltoncostaea marina TaxID=2843215 RepID=UPI001C3C75D2|nr:aminotransferase class I/II-fold pyridoxal phosphate-dependent enzyme [Miltoncostaea marina]